MKYWIWVLLSIQNLKNNKDKNFILHLNWKKIVREQSTEKEAWKNRIDSKQANLKMKLYF